MKPAEFDRWVRTELDAVEEALTAWVPDNAPAGLGQAMRYGVLDGGKRVRPLLVLAASQAVGGLYEAALRAACAVELIHAYSLIHDDMPCMDDDVLRRGKPTVHVQFGEAQAMLAGDAMQALAFEVLTPCAADSAHFPGGPGVPPVLQARLCALLARAAGQACPPHSASRSGEGNRQQEGSGQRETERAVVSLPRNQRAESKGTPMDNE